MSVVDGVLGLPLRLLTDTSLEVVGVPADEGSLYVTVRLSVLYSDRKCEPGSWIG